MMIMALLVLAGSPGTQIPKVYTGDVAKPHIDLGVVVFSNLEGMNDERLLAELLAAQATLHADAFIYATGDARAWYGLPPAAAKVFGVAGIFLPSPVVPADPARGQPGRAGWMPVRFEKNSYFRAIRFGSAPTSKKYRELTVAFLGGELDREAYQRAREALSAD